MKNSLKILTFPAMLFVFSNISAKPNKPNKPNIIFILADDLGYGDISYLNKKGKIQTPNIDKLMNNGTVFTDAHSGSSVSTPTRYGVLTGRYSWRSSLKQGVLEHYSSPLIDNERSTMAKMLKQSGYNTACIGKWHLGMDFTTKDGNKPIDEKDYCNIDFSKEILGGPNDVGFDYYFGVDAPNIPPYCFIENNKAIGVVDTYYAANGKMDSRPGRGLQDWNMYEILPTLEKKAVEYIDLMSNKEDPFFLYLPLTSPHSPIVPTAEFAGKSGLNNYADFVIQTDAVVGKIISELKKRKILDNTIIVFTADNGCSPVADYKLLDKKGHDPSYIFRGMKADLFEGGHRVPCVVSWNGVFQHQKVEQTICHTDFYATFSSLVKHKISNKEAEDSYNILPLMQKKNYNKTIREATVHHSFDGSFAIRQGKWKLLLTPYSGGWLFSRKTPTSPLPKFQLFNLEIDPSELKNLSESYPEIVENLQLLIEKYIKEGRSTPGKAQLNDGTYPWKELSWMN